jgi:hypothetical protein
LTLSEIRLSNGWKPFVSELCLFSIPVSRAGKAIKKVSDQAARNGKLLAVRKLCDSLWQFPK